MSNSDSSSNPAPRDTGLDEFEHPEPATPGLDDFEDESESHTTDTTPVSSDSETESEQPDEDLLLFEKSNEPQPEQKPAPEVSISFGVGTEDKTAETDEDKITDSDEAEEPDEVGVLENKLALEFGDTLSSWNNYTLPAGIILFVLGLLGLITSPTGGSSPFIDFINMIRSIFGADTALTGDSPAFRMFRINFSMDEMLLMLSVLLILGAIHLIFYWVVHKVSNTVKSNELATLIDQRRVVAPCIHLDCVEVEEPVNGTDDTNGVDVPELSDDGLPDEKLVWRCRHYDLDLEESVICAVCDKYTMV